MSSIVHQYHGYLLLGMPAALRNPNSCTKFLSTVASVSVQGDQRSTEVLTNMQFKASNGASA